MGTAYDIITVTCFVCIVLTYFLFTDREMKTLAHFMLPAAAFAIANQVGNLALHGGDNAHVMNALAVVLIAAGIAYTYLIVRH